MERDLSLDIPDLALQGDTLTCPKHEWAFDIRSGGEFNGFMVEGVLSFVRGIVMLPGRLLLGRPA